MPNRQYKLQSARCKTLLGDWSAVILSHLRDEQMQYPAFGIQRQASNEEARFHQVRLISYLLSAVLHITTVFCIDCVLPSKARMASSFLYSGCAVTSSQSSQVNGRPHETEQNELCGIWHM